MCLGSVCMDLPLIIWRENDVCLPSFQTVALGILFIMGAGLEHFLTDLGNRKTEIQNRTNLSNSFSCWVFCQFLLPPSPPFLGKICISQFLKEQTKNVLVSKKAGVYNLEGHLCSRENEAES